MATPSKPINAQAVRRAATTLMLAEGCTTTLCVKRFLRERGYHARQADVSELLYAVGRRQGWSINDNGLFRVYYLPRLIISMS